MTNFQIRLLFKLLLSILHASIHNRCSNTTEWKLMGEVEQEIKTLEVE